MTANLRPLTNWRAEAVPHGYDDGTTYQWEVHADAFDRDGNKLDVLLGSWLTEVTAKLIATAPDMYELLAWLNARGGLGIDVHERIVRTLAKAEGRT